jgi:hypothetical protein
MDAGMSVEISYIVSLLFHGLRISRYLGSLSSMGSTSYKPLGCEGQAESYVSY